MPTVVSTPDRVKQLILEKFGEDEAIPAAGENVGRLDAQSMSVRMSTRETNQWQASIASRPGGRFHITAQLVSTQNGYQLWRGIYDGQLDQRYTLDADPEVNYS